MLILSLLIPIGYVALISSANAELVAKLNSSNAVPDGGMTAILLGGALAVIAVLRRLVKR
jgi:hypothetical protein